MRGLTKIAKGLLLALLMSFFSCWSESVVTDV